jgi:hypothetical protein
MNGALEILYRYPVCTLEKIRPIQPATAYGRDGNCKLRHSGEVLFVIAYIHSSASHALAIYIFQTIILITMYGLCFLSEYLVIPNRRRKSITTKNGNMCGQEAFQTGQQYIVLSDAYLHGRNNKNICPRYRHGPGLASRDVK